MEVNGKRYNEIMKVHEEKAILVFVRPYLGFDGAYGTYYATPSEARTSGLEKVRLIKFYTAHNMDEIGEVSKNELAAIAIPRENVAFEIQDLKYFTQIAELIEKQGEK